MINNSINFSSIDQEVAAINTFSSKITTNSFEGSKLGNCVSWGGLVSNINCPKDFAFCNCHKKSLKIIPDKPEPTDGDLYQALKETKECLKIAQVFNDNERFLKFFGYDYSNPSSPYNCSCEEYYAEKNAFYIYYDTSEKAQLYYGATLGITYTNETYSNAGYFPYARRKSYTATAFGDIYAFPPNIKTKTTTDYKTSQNCSEQNIIGEFFPAYLEYSKTNAMFWNTPPETPLLRQAQTNSLFCQRIKILVNGTFKIKPGNMIDIEYPTPESKNIKQSRFAGKWMVYKIKRIINLQKHSMELYLMRDGLGQDPNIDLPTLEYNKEV